MLETEAEIQPLFYNYIAEIYFIPLIYYVKSGRVFRVFINIKANFIPSILSPNLNFGILNKIIG